MLAAMRKLPKSPEEARERLEAFLARYEGATEHTKSVTDCIDAARHLLSRLEQAD